MPLICVRAANDICFNLFIQCLHGFAANGFFEQLSLNSYERLQCEVGLRSTVSTWFNGERRDYHTEMRGSQFIC